MRTSWMTQQYQPTKAPVELTRSLLQQDEHLNARPRTMMEWKVFCHPSSISTFLKGSSVMRLSSATQFVPCIVPLCTDAADLHPMPVLADGGKQVKVWICKEPKAAEYNPLVFLGICLNQHAPEAQGEDFNSKITRDIEAAEICKHQAGTGETCELLMNLPFKCDCKGF